MDAISKLAKKFFALTPIQFSLLLLAIVLLVNKPFNMVIAVVMIFAKLLLGKSWRGAWTKTKTVMGAVSSAVKESGAPNTNQTAAAPPSSQPAPAGVENGAADEIQVHGNAIVLPFHSLRNKSTEDFDREKWWNEQGRDKLIEIIKRNNESGRCACVLDKHMELPQGIIARSEIAEVLDRYGIRTEVNTGSMRITWEDSTLDSLSATCGA